MSGPLPDEWETYQLIGIGLSLFEADEISESRARELLSIHRIVKNAEAQS